MAKPEKLTTELGVTGISDDFQLTNSSNPSLRGTRIFKLAELVASIAGKLGEKKVGSTTRAMMRSIEAYMIRDANDAAQWVAGQV